MRKITEEDVINYYEPLVMRECENAYKGMDREDRISEGRSALVYAIRTYKVQYGSFQEYLLLQLRTIMKQKNKEAWAVKRLESQVSLDASLVNDDAGSAMSNFFEACRKDDTILSVNSFVESLSPLEEEVLSLLMNHCSIRDVSNKVKLSLSQVQSVIDCLKLKATVYFEIGKS